jgi:hypothetical protein
MEIIRDDTIGGFNTFLKEQKALPGKATLSLVQFDSQDPYEVVHNFKDIQEVPELTRDTFVPRACTPLLDAIGRSINDVASALAVKTDKPEKVVIVIITDGQENASMEFRKDQIEKMVKEKQDTDKWQFVFLSADLASIGDAMALGFNAASTMAYDQDKHGVKSMYSSISHSVASYRTGASSVTFTAEDRAKQKSEKLR